MATLQQSIELLIGIIGRGCTPEDRRIYEAELVAYTELKRGDPYNEARWNHIDQRYAYRAAWERATWQKKIEG
jgi:hypothetical protein